MKGHFLTILMSLAATAISAVVFIVALFHQFALVEVVASLLTGLQVFFLSSAIGDAVDRMRGPRRFRNSVVVLATLFLLAFYSVTLYLHRQV